MKRYKGKLYSRLEKEDKEYLKGEVLNGLVKIRVTSLYDQPSKKIADRHSHKFGLCQNCEHFQLCASESQVKKAWCSELKIKQNSAQPVTECSWYVSREYKTDVQDMLHMATIIDEDEDKTCGII